MAGDLLRALVARSVSWGQPMVDQHASSSRTYRVRIVRPHSDPVFDRVSGQMTNPPDQLLYEGWARVRPASGAGSAEIGDEVVHYAAATISIDDYDGPQPRHADLVEVLQDSTSSGTRIAGRRFKVDDVQVGGLLDYGVVMNVTGVAPSRRNQ